MMIGVPVREGGWKTNLDDRMTSIRILDGCSKPAINVYLCIEALWKKATVSLQFQSGE